MSPSSTFWRKKRQSEINCHRVVHVNDWIFGFLRVILDIGCFSILYLIFFWAACATPKCDTQGTPQCDAWDWMFRHYMQLRAQCSRCCCDQFMKYKKSRNMTGFCLQDECSSCLHFPANIISFQHLKLVGWTHTVKCVYTHRY